MPVLLELVPHTRIALSAKWRHCGHEMNPMLASHLEGEQQPENRLYRDRGLRRPSLINHRQAQYSPEIDHVAAAPGGRDAPSHPGRRAIHRAYPAATTTAASTTDTIISAPPADSSQTDHRTYIMDPWGMILGASQFHANNEPVVVAVQLDNRPKYYEWPEELRRAAPTPILTSWKHPVVKGDLRTIVLQHGHLPPSCTGPGHRQEALQPAEAPVKIVFFDREEAWLRTPILRLGLLGSLCYAFTTNMKNISAVYNLEFCGVGDCLAIWPIGHKESTLSVFNK